MGAPRFKQPSILEWSSDQARKACHQEMDDRRDRRFAFIEPQHSPTYRPHHSDLQPLTIVHHHRRGSGVVYQVPPQGYVQSPQSAISLASPTLMGVRQYYRGHGLTTAFRAERTARTPTAARAMIDPTLISPASLAHRLEFVSMVSPGRAVTRQSARRQSLMDASRSMLLRGVQGSDLAHLGAAATQRRVLAPVHCISSIPPRIPAAYTEDNLREWAAIYLGNAQTADVFVKAVSLRPSDNTMSSTSEDVIIRARVLPRQSERKPFLIQRKFNILELRCVSRSRSNSNTSMAHFHSKDPTSAAASSPSPGPEVRRDSTGVPPSPPVTVSKVVSRRVVPIHVEFARHFLPVLGALMLSGYIRRGDAIDLPLPRPEAWREAVAYAYTGKGAVTAAMRENILYLAGRVEEE